MITFYIAHKDEVMVSSNDAGIQKVIDDGGKYAFFMESASIEYIIERKCKVTQVGGLLDDKVSLELAFKKFE